MLSLFMTSLPRLTQSHCELTRQIEVMDELGTRSFVAIPAERPLTVYVDKHELITLMTLGAHPEWLVLGYLRNQRLIESAGQLDSITVDWEAGDALIETTMRVANGRVTCAEALLPASAWATAPP